MKSKGRLTVDVGEDVLMTLQKYLPWGVKARIIRLVLEEFILKLKANPDTVRQEYISRVIPYCKGSKDGNNNDVGTGSSGIAPRPCTQACSSCKGAEEGLHTQALNKDS